MEPHSNQDSPVLRQRVDGPPPELHHIFLVHDFNLYRAVDQPKVQTRKAAAQETGLSPHQQKQATRVANIPEEEFEEAVESDTLPNVTAEHPAGTSG